MCRNPQDDLKASPRFSLQLCQIAPSHRAVSRASLLGSENLKLLLKHLADVCPVAVTVSVRFLSAAVVFQVGACNAEWGMQVRALEEALSER